MKKLWMYLILVSLMLGNLNAQVGNQVKVRIFKCKISLLNGNKEVGWLYEAGEDSVIIGQVKPDDPHFWELLFPFAVAEISGIKIWRKGSELRGALIGMGVGGLAGGVYGAVSGNYSEEVDIGLLLLTGENFSSSSSRPMIQWGALGSLVGGFTGLMLEEGLPRKHYVLNGDPQVYRQFREEMNANFALYWQLMR